MFDQIKKLRLSLNRRYLTWRLKGRPIDAYLVSYPKTGRTWLGLLLGQTFSNHFGVNALNPLDVERVAGYRRDIPRVRITHDGQPDKRTPAEIRTQDKANYAQGKVILLVRDPRDVLVSDYFQLTRREGDYVEQTPISDFIRRERGGVDAFIAFYNHWIAHRDTPTAFTIVRYEDLHADTASEVQRLCTFLGLPAVDRAHLASAVEVASFGNMRKAEANDTYGSSRLRPVNKDDPESFKTRKGEVGGHRGYLDDDDIAYLSERMTELDAAFGYRGD